MLPHPNNLKVSRNIANNPVVSDVGCRATKFVFTLGGPQTPSMVKFAEEAKVSLVDEEPEGSESPSKS